MLLLMMELKGRFNTKMIKKAKFGDVYFDEMGSFDSVERDRVTNAVGNLSSFSSMNLNSIGIRTSFGKSTFPSRPGTCAHG
jgi:hypothetical protein